jgi:dTDP-glucose pyrophosphorylase/CBS domain-containing protein
MNYPDVANLFINLESSIREAIECIDGSGRVSIALIVDDAQRLIGTITDGDIRRGILAGLSMNDPVSRLMPIKAQLPRPPLVTAPVDTDPIDFLSIMRENAVKQLPLIDADGRIVDIVILSELLPAPKLPLQAVIMAGGMGTRLKPLTDNIPKPMLSVGGRPIMELILETLQHAGVERVDVSTNYRSSDIVDYFGDGKGFGVELNYIREDRPLGTAGALGLRDRPEGTLLVINGDVLTQVNFGMMLAYHQEHKADITVGVRQYRVQVPYGVIECEGSSVRALKEKPELAFLVNAGIYLLEPSVYDFISKGEHLDMTELIQKLLDNGRPVTSFPIIEYWIDIGQPADYQRAQEDAREGKHKLGTTHDPAQQA